MPFLIEIVIALVVIGLALWVIEQIPMDATIAKIIRIVIIVLTCLWLLSFLAGYLPPGGFPQYHR